MNNLPELPKPDQSRIHGLEPSLVIAAYLHGNLAAPSRGQLSQRLHRLIGGEAILEAGLESLAGCDKVWEHSGKLKLTESGQRWIEETVPCADDWRTVQNWILPSLTLGLDPRRTKTASVMKNRFEGTTLAVLYGFASGDEGMTSASAASAYLFHQMKGRFPEWQVPGRPPETRSLDPISNCWLNAAAGLNRSKVSTCVSELVAQALGAKDRKRDSLKRALIVVALGSKTSPTSPTDFADQVRDLARSVHKEPFDGRTSIARVYDAWSRQTNDPGSLEAFKERLVRLAREGSIELVRLDDARMMDPHERSRSATRLGLGEVHFVVFKWV